VDLTNIAKVGHVIIGLINVVVLNDNRNKH